MPEDRARRRIHDEVAAIAEQNAYTLEILARSLEILKQALPDTFLGRKTYEPFPSEPSAPLQDDER
ncbi:hypothetical protein NLM27_05510 [Bradyrhizobium sp. CCGB12]|uniref:hypothetical protein n=1 Tax=Bradyrhizobium sp. CCGB12 TaxID=2949632 RepID=UPI0020B29715|nr:hypothetical protein [Bradyrhizobium sp. CCGB12]MCP3388235.1 hypothetical protein [Bradyrhizobium sp. CCGB12]